MKDVSVRYERWDADSFIFQYDQISSYASKSYRSNCNTKVYTNTTRNISVYTSYVTIIGITFEGVGYFTDLKYSPSATRHQSKAWRHWGWDKKSEELTTEQFRAWVDFVLGFTTDFLPEVAAM